MSAGSLVTFYERRLPEARPAMRHAVWILAVLLIAAVWGNWVETGAGSPAAPHVVETTLVAKACAAWPYLVRDANGIRFEPLGLVLGGVVTLLIVLGARHWTRGASSRRSLPPVS